MAGSAQSVVEKTTSPMDMITITKATEADYPDLATLQLRSMRTIAASHYSDAQIEAFLADATPGLMGVIRIGTVWLARAQRQLVGSAAWHFDGELPTLGQKSSVNWRVAIFRTVYVRPDWTRRGLASKLMSRAEADAVSRGANFAKLHSMLGAVEFYRSRGYATVGETIFDLDGVRFPGISMTRNLSKTAAEAA